MTRSAYLPVLRFVAGYYLRVPRLFGGFVVARVAASLFDVCIPLASARIVDAVVTSSHPDLAPALWALALFTMLLFGNQLSRLAMGRLLNRVTTSTMSVLVRDAFGKVQRFSAEWHANAFAGATVRQITRGMWSYEMFTDTVAYGLAPAFVVVVGVTAMMAFRWPLLAGVLAVGIAAYLVVAVALSVFWAGAASQRSQVLDSRLSATIADALTSNAVVKGFAAEKREDQLFGSVVLQWNRLTQIAWDRNVVASFLQAVVLLFIQAAVIGLGLWQWTRGQAGAGDVAGLVASQILIGGYLREIGQHVRNAQRAINEMEDLVAFSRMPLDVDDRAGAPVLKVTRGHIVFDGVTFGYAASGAPLYDRFSVEIRAGERVGLVGASGAGKSTFVKLIQRLYDVDAGRILIDGQDIAHVSQASLRAAIGLVAQEPILFHRTLADNIAYGHPGASATAIGTAARQAHAHEFIGRLPAGYETLVGERGVKLSGGERQRVAIARAILADTPILILDEATSSLDTIAERLIRDAIESLSQGRTTLVVAHRLSTVQRLDRILVFERGRIVEDGSHAELMARGNGYYRRLFETQSHDARIDEAA